MKKCNACTRKKKGLFSRLFSRKLSAAETVGASLGAGVLAVATVGLVSRALGGGTARVGEITAESPTPGKAVAKSGLLRSLIGLRTNYQRLHWNAQGYADHLLFERLYKSLDDDIDKLAELALARGGTLDVADVTSSVNGSPLAAEDAIIAAANGLVGKSPAFDNYLFNLVQNREHAVYLLRQSAGTSAGVGIIGRPRDPGYPFQKQDIRASAYSRKRRQEAQAALMAERPPKSPFRRRMEKRGFHNGPTYGGVRRRKVFMEAKTDDEILQLRHKLKEARAQVRAEKRAQLARLRKPKVLIVK